MDTFALLTIDSITNSKQGPVPIDRVNTVLTRMDKTLHISVPNIGNRYTIIELTWEFLNLVKSRHSDAAIAAVRKQFETWKHDFPDPDTVRWIDQALTRDGPFPSGPLVGGITMDADGKIILDNGTPVPASLIPTTSPAMP
jgi:hypothetical protein